MIQEFSFIHNLSNKMNKILYRLLRLTGLPFIIRELIQRRKITILLFHDINAESAKKSFNYISKRYNIICLNDLLRAVENGTLLPKKSVILTFDDGHIRNYELLSIVKELEIPVTIFLCSSIINTNRQFWFKYPDLPKDKTFLKKLPNIDRLGILKKAGFEQEMEFNIPQALQSYQIEEMKEFFNFQSHTLFHPILPSCSNTEAEHEIHQSKKDLEMNYNMKINAFSFPNGDYTSREKEYVKKAGYSCAITVDFGYNNLNSDLFQLRRISVNDTGDLNELAVKSSGLWAFLKSKASKIN